MKRYVLNTMKSLVFGSLLGIAFVCYASSTKAFSGSKNMTVEYNGETIPVSQVGQRGGQIATANGVQSVPVMIFSSHPFYAGEEIDTDYDQFALNNAMTINIASTDGNILIPDDESYVPIWMEVSPDGNLVSASFVRATGVTWKFQQAGMQFITATHTYTVENAGATISFTNDGVVLDGVTEAPR
jgi:hypothetical protein